MRRAPWHGANPKTRGLRTPAGLPEPPSESGNRLDRSLPRRFHGNLAVPTAQNKRKVAQIPWNLLGLSPRKAQFAIDPMDGNHRRLARYCRVGTVPFFSTALCRLFPFFIPLLFLPFLRCTPPSRSTDISTPFCAGWFIDSGRDAHFPVPHHHYRLC